MKKLSTPIFLALSIFSFSQSNAELKNEIETIKTEISALKTEIQTVKTQNVYLKKVLDINTPILELKISGNEYRITKVAGNKKEKTITINMLVEAKDENKTSYLQDVFLVDLLGNQYQLDFVKSTDTNPKLTANVPLNVKLTFKEVNDEPKIIKLLKFQSRNEPERNSADFNKSVQEFKDLNVVWE